MLLQRRGLLCCGCGGGAVVGGRGAFGGETIAAADRRPGGAIKDVARQVSWAQVEAMTGGFTSAIVGEGGFSTVYLARLGGGSLAAVKVHRSSSERLHRAFRQELDALLRVRHPHIVRLLAFCDHPHHQGVLVLEFAPNGNLHDHLHVSRTTTTTMPWARRVSVALQLGRALEYLHDRQLVHGDVKASNVLLDSAMAARLCDFGSARAGFSAAVVGAGPRTRRPSLLLAGSPGYVDPHYLRSGVVTKKSDVYSFGVLLLELLTGVHPFRDGRLLTAVVAPKIIGACDAAGLVDPRLGCRYDTDEAAAVLALATACVGDNPTLRPSMADVVRALERTGHGQASISGGGGKLQSDDVASLVAVGCDWLVRSRRC